MRPRALWLAALSLSGCTLLVGDRLTSGPGSQADLASAPPDLQVAPGSDGAGAPSDLATQPSFADAAHSSMGVNPASVTADGSSNTIVSVTVKDAAGNPVNGQPVSLAATGTGNTITPATGITNGLGIFNATLTSTVAEAKTVTATVAGFMLQAQVTFTAGNAQAGSSSLAVSPASVTADGSSTAALTVTVKDANGNPVPAAPVSLGVSGSANTLGAMSGATNSTGVFATTLASTKAEAKTVTATVAGFMLMQPVTFTAGAVSAAQSTVAASPTSGLVANGVAASTITVTLRDANANLIGGTGVTVSATGTGNTLTPASAMTNGSGVMTSQLTSSQGGAKTVSAVASGVTITQMPQVTFTGCPSNGTLTSGAAATAGDTSAAPNLYHPSCALGGDGPEHVYNFTLGATSSVLLDRGAAFAGSLTDLRPRVMSCSADPASLVCTSNRYLYCPSLSTGSYEVVVDGSGGATGAYAMSLLAQAPKGTNSYGIASTAPTFTSIISVAGAPVIPDTTIENGTATVVLPFNFRYFGTQHLAGESIVVYQSGYIGFGGTVVNTHVNTCLPTATLPAETIAPFWSWLNGRPASNGNTYVATQGVAGSRTFTVEWDSMDASANASSYECITVSIQAILYEATGQIEFRYKPIAEDLCAGNSTDQNYAVGGHSTIGLQGATAGALVEPVACNTAGGLGPAVIGTCSPRGTTTPCTANKGFLFVPRSATCP